MMGSVLLNNGGTEWKLRQLLYTDAVPLPDSKEELGRMIGHSDGMCKWRMLKENVNKSKVLVFENMSNHSVNQFEWRKKSEVLNELQYLGPW